MCGDDPHDNITINSRKPRANNHQPPPTQSSQHTTATQSSQRTKKDKKRSHDQRILFKQPADDDVIRILLATDNHLGYAEADSIRSNDSFTTFDEILQLANDNHCDMVVLGGDLYHENKPTRNTLYKTGEILTKHVLGERKTQLSVVSDQAVNFAANYNANIYNENVHIKMPIFTIHGNHDDPAGHGALSTLDLLHQQLLVNYFGKQERLDNIVVNPIVIQKGSSTLNLYGLGNIRDERLYRAFQAGQVKFMQSNNNSAEHKRDDDGMNGDEASDVFNLCLFHQNRIKHSVTDKNYIPETFLPRWLHFVHWGHEHECVPEPVNNSEMDFKVLQIGSSVATSLATGEAAKKHVAIMQIKNASYTYATIPLQTVRPFDISDVKLSDIIMSTDAEAHVIEDMLETHIDGRLEALAADPQYQNPERPALPLIRVRVDHTGYQRINTIRFGQRYVNRVANPDDLLLWQKKATASNAHTNRSTGATVDPRMQLLQSEDPEAPPPIYDLVSEIIAATTPLNVLLDHSFSHAVQQYVEKKETRAIEDVVNELIEKCQIDAKKRLSGEKAVSGGDGLTEEEIVGAVKKYHSTAVSKQPAKQSTRSLGINLSDVDQTLRDAEANAATNPRNTDLFGSDDDEYVNSDDASDEEERKSTPKKKRGAAATRGRAKGGARGGKSATARRAQTREISDDDDEISVKAEQPIKTESGRSSTQRKLPNSLTGGPSGSGRKTAGTAPRTTQTTLTSKRPKMGRLNMSQVSHADDDVIDMT